MRKAFTICIVFLAGVLTFYFVQQGTVTNGEIPGESGDTGSGISSSSSVKTTASRVPGRELDCADGSDNEGDNLTDCDDPDCSGSQECRCSVLSCGSEGVFTCSAENGCICDDVSGCVSCRQKNQVCTTKADCCYGLALECTEVVLGTGGREKRCLPSQRQICTIRCQDSPGSDTGAIWGRTESCSPAVMIPGIESCDALVGACNLSPNSDRNLRKCWRS